MKADSTSCCRGPTDADRYQRQWGLGGSKRIFLFATPTAERFGAQSVLQTVGFLRQLALQPGIKVLLPVGLPLPFCHLERSPKGVKIAWDQLKITGGTAGRLR